jgi:5'-3' exonuclease
MGIKNLNSILKRYAPHTLTKQVPLSEYVGRTVAVDASVYMYKYKSVYGRQWISVFYNFLTSLSGVRCVFVFDSKTCIHEKVAERARRSSQKRALRERVDEVRAALEAYKQTGAVAQVLRQFSPTNTNFTRLISTSARGDASAISVEKIEEYIAKSDNHLLPIYQEDFDTVRKMCNSVGFATITAEIEAEKLCALLCHEKKVDAIMTEDSDALVYITPRILHKVSGGQCIELSMPRILEALDMSPAQFVDMCILCGTDYAPSVPGIGPMKAHKFIKTCGSIDEISKYNFGSLNHVRVREIFAIEPSGVDAIAFPDPDPVELTRILFENNVRVHSKTKWPHSNNLKLS